jgi:signal transduction histidine kinase
MHSLETFTFPVAFAIERAALYERLQEELNRVTEAHTKLKVQQELIVRMEKMALVGRITSSIAHSIRNPLMIIGGFARSMLKNTPDGDPKRNFIESIVGEARQLEGVLDEILNYSDSLYPTKDFWDINQLVETALRDSADTLGTRGYKSTFSAGSELPPAYIDFKQVSYCLSTILQCNLNGTGRERLMDINTGREDGTILIRIQDHGQYISQEEMDAILVPFSSTQEMGVGLGLALCKTMLEKQGIPLNAQTAPEDGIIFTILLPIQKEEQQ